jgi:8-oxo-dGTP pyrophosphatase MutT (NUDIX family)
MPTIQSSQPTQALLESLSVRFILSLPTSELQSFERLLFSVEQAWWHYEDHERHKHNTKSLSLKEFTGLIFDSCPGLEPFHGSLEQIYQAFTEYKRTVPVCGAILLDPPMKKCLLVRGFKEGSGWGFPKGKLSLNESDEECAVREVMEETGFDISGKLIKKDYIRMQIGDQATKLFIIQGVDESTPFAPHVRGEIGAFGWHIIEHLPSSKSESKNVYFDDETGSRHRFYNVWPYMKKLRAWIAKNGKQRKEGKGDAKIVDGRKSESGPRFVFDRDQILGCLNAHLTVA